MKKKKLDVMIFYKALWPVTRTTLISEFRWLLYAIALLSAISHLWDAFWWAKTHLEFQGFSPFCLWTKLHEHGWMTADASCSLVSCSDLTSLGPFPSGWLTNILITGEIPFRFRLNVIEFRFNSNVPFFSPLSFPHYGIPCSLFAGFLSTTCNQIFL